MDPRGEAAAGLTLKWWSHCVPSSAVDEKILFLVEHEVSGRSVGAHVRSFRFVAVARAL
jgi:hypothetical protein